MAEKKYSLYNNTEVLDQRLAVEIGEGYIVLVAGAGGRISGLEYFTAEDTLEETLNDINQLSSLIKKNYSETRVFYNLEEAVMVPVGLFNSSVAAEFVDLAFGNKADARVNVENIDITPGIVNVYRSNEHWQEIINRHFRVVTKKHLYSKLVEDVVAGNESLRIIIYQNTFTIVAVKNKQLKIVRSFSFSSDADVLYHILNVCKQVDIDVASAPMHVSGFVDKDSSLLQLLKKYIGSVKLYNAAYNDMPSVEKDQYPHHYFTSFINLLS